MSEASHWTDLADMTRQLETGDQKVAAKFGVGALAVAGKALAANRPNTHVDLARNEIEAAMDKLGVIPVLDEQQSATVESARSALDSALAALKAALSSGASAAAQSGCAMSGADVLDELAGLAKWLQQQDEAKDGEGMFETVRSVRAAFAELLAEQMRLKAELAAATGAAGKPLLSAADIEMVRQEIRSAERELDSVTGRDDDQANALGCAESALSRALSALEGKPVGAVKQPQPELAADPAATARWAFIAQAFDTSKISASQRLLEAICLPSDEACNPLAWHIDRAIARKLIAEQAPA